MVKGMAMESTSGAETCSPREVVDRAIRFRCPPRLPLITSVSPLTIEMHGRKLEDLISRYPNDFGWAGWSILDDGPPRVGVHVDEWGCTWQKLDASLGGQCVGHPLEDWGAWDRYSVPDPLNDSRWTGVGEHVSQVAEKGKYILGGGGYLFEKLWALRGFENTFVDLALEPAELDELIAAIDGYVDRTLERGLGFEVDGIIFGDDWGQQNSLFVNPEIWRRRFLPVYERWFARVHEADRNVHFHSDGNVMEVLPDFVAMGANELNIQLGVLDIEKVAAHCRDRVCIRAEPDRQSILPYGSPDDVRSHVKDIVGAFHTERGGLIMSIKVMADMPWENLVAFFEALDPYL